MKDVAPWKWGVLIGAGVLSVVVWVFILGGGNDPKLATGVKVIDIETGQVYFMPIPPQRMLPARSPETGNRSLWPCREELDGSFTLESRYISQLENAEHLKIEVDFETGKVTTNGKEVQTIE